MPVTDLPDQVRAEVARAFMEHKSALGLLQASDEVILDRAGDILAVLLDAADEALELRSAHWFRRYAWFVDLIKRLGEGRLKRLVG